jgi:hypothetical protein
LSSLGLLARLGAHQVEVLSYADCFLFMATLGALALPFVFMIAPPASPKK